MHTAVFLQPLPQSRGELQEGTVLNLNTASCGIYTTELPSFSKPLWGWAQHMPILTDPQHFQNSQNTPQAAFLAITQKHC